MVEIVGRNKMFKKILQKVFPQKKSDCCAAEQTLSDIKIGQSVRIECLRGEEAACQRLREIGFSEKSIIEKIADSGTVICKVCDAKIAISKNLAKNIIVKDLSTTENLKVGRVLLLSQLTPGQKGKIYGFVSESEDYDRIEEMGVTPGEAVEMVRRAPLGDPIEIRIRGYLLSLRKDEADFIQVELN